MSDEMPAHAALSQPGDATLPFPDLPEAFPELAALSRREFARLISLLTRRLGDHHLELAEDSVQEAFAAAARRWPADGVPENPVAWLYQVAWRKALDQLRRVSPDLSLDEAVGAPDNGTLDDGASVADAELRLVLLCCHPALPVEAQVTLTLRVAAAFSIPEIARLLGASEDAVDQRLLRARRRLRTEVDVSEIPAGDLARRATVALDVIYAMFSEGYASHTAATGLRRDLCAEAIRLTMMLQRHPETASREAHALAALFAFLASRLDVRFDATGGFQSLRDQDRSGWSAALIAFGSQQLAQSRGDSLSRFHLEAEIASCHAAAHDYASTDWHRIVEVYDLLNQHWPSSQLALNRAIAIGERDGPTAAISALQQEADRLDASPHFHAALADAYHRLGDREQTRLALKRALDLAIAPRQIRTLGDRLSALTV